MSTILPGYLLSREERLVMPPMPGQVLPHISRKFWCWLGVNKSLICWGEWPRCQKEEHGNTPSISIHDSPLEMNTGISELGPIGIDMFCR